MMKYFSFLLLALVISPLLSAQSGDIEVTEGYVRRLPPGVVNTAAFMRILNRGYADRVLVGGSTPAADSVSIHATINDNGMMKMEHQMNLVIPAQGEVLLESGGLHLMLMGLKGSLGEEEVELNLSFLDGRTISLRLPVINILDEIP